jgi:hypothetical protein
MATKQELVNDIRTMPDGYHSFLDVAIPGPPGEPSDVEAAQKKVGQLAEYITNILSAFQGLHPLKIPAHMGQRNEAVLGLLLASLQVNEDTGDFNILEPASGISYATGENSVSIEILSGTMTNISCTVYPPSMAGFVIAEFEEIEPGVWLAPITYEEVGTYELTFIVKFGEALKVKETTAEVQ